LGPPGPQPPLHRPELQLCRRGPGSRQRARQASSPADSGPPSAPGFCSNSTLSTTTATPRTPATIGRTGALRGRRRLDLHQIGAHLKVVANLELRAAAGLAVDQDLLSLADLQDHYAVRDLEPTMLFSDRAMAQPHITTPTITKAQALVKVEGPNFIGQGNGQARVSCHRRTPSQEDERFRISGDRTHRSLVLHSSSIRGPQRGPLEDMAIDQRPGSRVLAVLASPYTRA
jgi:hypothetical protein